MNERKSLWTVHPKVIHLSPQDGSGCQLGVSVALDAPSLSHAHHGPRTRQRLRCAVEELEFLDFGTIFTTQTCSREVIIKNHGQFGRRLAWAKEKAAVLSRNRIDFEFLWDKNRPISSITESLRLENNGPLEVRFTVQVQYPFSTDIEEGGIPPDGSQEILVDFDPGYKVDRKSGTVKQRMAIQYDEHPAVNMVDLVGKVVWPNIELDTHKIDFGTVLNDTSKKMEVGMNIEGLA
eukprot:g24088.t1